MDLNTITLRKLRFTKRHDIDENEPLYLTFPMNPAMVAVDVRIDDALSLPTDWAVVALPTEASDSWIDSLEHSGNIPAIVNGIIEGVLLPEFAKYQLEYLHMINDEQCL